MDPVYTCLAKRLDKFPHGYPSTESGVELKILEKIFRPEDAAFALRLKMVPEPVSIIARRVGLSTEDARSTLDRMAAAGQILSTKIRGRRKYMLAPFVVGIYEFQMPRMDTELAELFEEYAPTLLGTLGAKGPSLARVVPVNKSIDAKAEVLRYESVHEMISRARSFRVMDCICRKEKAAVGEPCSHTLETCLTFASSEGAYDEFPWWGRSISREEALDVLDRAEQEGLVHCTYNLQSQNMFVCNCCSCCCGFMRGIKEFDAPHLLLRSNYLAVIDPESCEACGLCAEQSCPMEAIEEGDDAFAVIDDRCIGCGVCTVTCPTDAITMELRPESDRTEPPKNIAAWSFQRAMQRSGPVRTLAQFGGLAIDNIRARRGE